VLGAAAPANASCPINCLVEARVTGFQTSIGKTKNPFMAPADGQIVSWSIKLGKPKKADVRSFNDKFGTPQARLAVLKPVPGTSNPTRYKLLRQSPAQPLGKILGQISTFNLASPLPVLAGQVVALTIPTWAPAFAVGQGGSTRWMASRRATRKRGGCTDDEGRANVDAGAPQVKKGKQQPYGCAYNSARLLYTATFVADGL
ncbi:MAG: hypothetical protein M3O25_08810, partial [Actinomycetota bacterium]|nr:hypothetical protein [Actinomycetota bacterium]